jgi:hypothetical protein
MTLRGMAKKSLRPFAAVFMAQRFTALNWLAGLNV